MIKNISKTLFALVFLTTILWANVAMAYNYTELAPLPGTAYTCMAVVSDGTCTRLVESSSNQVQIGKGSTLGAYINGIYKLAVASASVLAVVMIVMGGFTYVSSDAMGNKEEGKSQIKAALGGVLLILASWIILNTVNPQLVNLKIVTKPLSARVLTPLMTGQQAQENFDWAYRNAMIKLNTLDQTTDKMKEMAGSWQEGAETYRDLARMRDLLSGSSLSPEEKEELFLLQSFYDPDGLADVADITQLANQACTNMKALAVGTGGFSNDCDTLADNLQDAAVNLRIAAIMKDNVEGSKIFSEAKIADAQSNYTNGDLSAWLSSAKAIVSEYERSVDTALKTTDDIAQINDALCKIQASTQSSIGKICAMATTPAEPLPGLDPRIASSIRERNRVIYQSIAECKNVSASVHSYYIENTVDGVTYKTCPNKAGAGDSW